MVEHDVAAPVAVDVAVDVAADVSVPVAVDVRAALRGQAEGSFNMLSSFFADAIQAKREVRGKCPKCSRDVPVTVPDFSARTSAVKLLLEQGYGKVPDAPGAAIDAQVAEIADRAKADMDSLGDDELRLFVAYESAKEGRGDDSLRAMIRDIARRVLALPEYPVAA